MAQLPTPPPAPARPAALRRAAILTYLQAIVAIGAVLGAYAAASATDGITAALYLYFLRAIVYCGYLLLLAACALSSAPLLSRRARWARVVAVAVQIALVVPLVATPVLLLHSPAATLLVFTAPCAAIAALAVVNLIQLSRPAVSRWYE